MNKTRNQLQKEIDYLKSVIKEKDKEIQTLDAECTAIHSEKEHESKVALQACNETANWRLKNEQLQNQLTAQERVSIEQDKLITEIKSKTLFQLIKWWWNEKRKKI